MAKDPAFLFYSSDFYTGTAFMSDEQVGKYIRLLCLQHQHGHLDAGAMQKLCGGIADAAILDKFLVDDDGKYYNQRLDIEIDKRKKHSEKQKQNALMRWHKSGNAVAMPLEDENENEDINKDTDKEKKKEVFVFSLPENFPYREQWEAWIDMRKRTKKPATEYAKKLAYKKLTNFPADQQLQILTKSIVSNWTDFYDLKPEEKKAERKWI